MKGEFDIVFRGQQLHVEVKQDATYIDEKKIHYSNPIDTGARMILGNIAPFVEASSKQR